MKVKSLLRFLGKKKDAFSKLYLNQTKSTILVCHQHTGRA